MGKIDFYNPFNCHGLRLSTYLVVREIGHGEDKRYSALREKLGKHFWWLSYFIVFLPAMALNMLLGYLIYAFINAPKSNIHHISYWVGIATMVCSGLFAAIADLQKYNFTTAKKNEGKVVDVGLWSLSRHPNYLGEFVYWWGVYLVNFSVGILWTIIAPLIFSFLILFVTGVPLMERRMRDEYGEKYEDYRRRVPIFFPIPFYGVSHRKSDGKGDTSSRGKEESSPQKRHMDQSPDRNKAKAH